MRRCVFVLPIFILCCVAAQAQTPVASEASTSTSSELDLPSYQRELARIEQSSKNTQEIRRIRESLPESWAVRAGHYVYSVPTKEISDTLRQIEHDPNTALRGQLEARLKTMQRHAEALSGQAALANATDADEKLTNILNRGEFQEARGPSDWDRARARIVQWIVLRLIRLLGVLHISQRTGNSIAWSVLFLALVALFYAIYRWLSKGSSRVDLRAEVAPAPGDARRWVQQAQAAADRGDFREAIHCAYWASVAHLEDLRMLPKDRARTPRESVRILSQYPKEQGVLQTITRSFELIWYGYRPVSLSDWAGTKEQLEKMGCLRASIAPTVPS